MSGADPAVPAGPGAGPFSRPVAIFGVGLIGASIGLAIRRLDPAIEIVGIGRREESLSRALAAGAIDRFTTRPREGLEGAGLVFLCAPVGTVVSCLGEGMPGLEPDALVTDACSTKRRVVEAARRLPRPGRFVGGHPIAGSERSGPDAAREDLFPGRPVILTPTGETEPQALEAVRRFWIALGSRVFCLEPAEHDRILALTSHLPHLLASAMSSMVGRRRDRDTMDCLGSGFRDLTRIAAGDPVLWREIMATNADNLAGLLEDLGGVLARWRETLLAGDAAGLEKLLAEAADFQALLRAPGREAEEEEQGRHEHDR